MTEKTLMPIDGRFLVIGCGSIGRRHLRNLRELGIRDIAAVDVREDRRQDIAHEFGVPVFSDLDKALCENTFAALICTPTHLHLLHALAAAQKGCHLFIEKPIAAKLDGLDTLLHEVRQRQLKSLVGCNYRFHPGLRLTKTLLDQNAIGNVVSASARFGQYLADWRPWMDYRHAYSAHRSEGGGVVLDRIHEIDYLYWLFGDIYEVYANAAQLSHLEIEAEDVANILLRFASGVLGSVHVDYVRRVYDCSLSVIGGEGIIEWSFQDHRVRWYSSDDQTWHSVEWPRYDSNQMYIDEMLHFIRVLQGQEKPEVNLEDGRRVLEVALAALRSSTEHKPVFL